MHVCCIVTLSDADCPIAESVSLVGALCCYVKHVFTVYKFLAELSINVLLNMCELYIFRSIPQDVCCYGITCDLWTNRFPWLLGLIKANENERLFQIYAVWWLKHAGVAWTNMIVVLVCSSMTCDFSRLVKLKLMNAILGNVYRQSALLASSIASI